VEIYWLVLGVLGVWRFTHLLFAEDGPWAVAIWMRQRAGTGFWGSLLDCFYCLSLWTAAPFALLLGSGWKERLLLWPALSAGAILFERVTSGEATSFERGALPAGDSEAEGAERVMLRGTQGAASQGYAESGKS
jgi:hypothetical protein